MRRILSVFLSFAGLFALTGCHSAYVETTVHNATGAPVTLIEVDYPSASFGTEQMQTNADFHYRFKILGNGGTKVLWTDAKRQEHTVQGPSLTEGQEGKMLVTLSPLTATWQMTLNPKH